MLGPGQTDEVCLVDDDLSVLRSMQYLLASDGLKVRAFNKPEEFLDHANEHPVPAVVTNIWMDGVTGCVIVINAREDLATRATAMAIGPIAHFMKPFNDGKFLAAVRDALVQTARH